MSRKQKVIVGRLIRDRTDAARKGQSQAKGVHNISGTICGGGLDQRIGIEAGVGAA